MDKHSEEFLYKYLNNHSPTGFESSGQKIWLDYIKPYIDEYISDTYGTVVGVINPNAKYKFKCSTQMTFPSTLRVFSKTPDLEFQYEPSQSWPSQLNLYNHLRQLFQ